MAHPERVRGLILFETLGAQPPDGGSGELVQHLVDRLLPEERAQLDALVAQQTEGDEAPEIMASILGTLWPSYWFDRTKLVPPVSLRLEQPLPGEPDTMTSVRAHLAAGTLQRGLPKMTAPTLFIHGAGDPMPLAATTDTAALIPGGRVEIVEEAGHYPWLEQRDTVRDLVEAFVGSVPD